MSLLENSQKEFCPPCKKEQGGGLYPRCKKHGRDYVHLYKNEQKGFCPGGILSVYHYNLLASVLSVFIFHKVIITDKWHIFIQLDI